MNAIELQYWPMRGAMENRVGNNTQFLIRILYAVPT